MDLRVVIDREKESEVILDEMFVFTSTEREVIRSELTAILQRLVAKGEDDFGPGDTAVVEVGDGCEVYMLDCAFNSSVELVDP